MNHTTGWTSEVVERELKYTLEKIDKVPKNESAWNYLRVCIIIVSNLKVATADR